MRNRTPVSSDFAVCIRNGEYEADLVVGKIYRVLKPRTKDKPADIRVFDESGEDYLYPREWFVPVTLSMRAKKALVAVR